MTFKKPLKNKISLKVASFQRVFYLRSIRNGRFFLSQFFLEVSPSAPSLPAGCIPLSSSLGTSQRSQQISPGPWPFSRNVQQCWMVVHPKGWAWLVVCPGHTQCHGSARRARLLRIIRLGGFSVISKGGGHHVFKKRSLRTLPAFEWRNSWQRYTNLTVGVAKLTFSLNNFLRLYFTDVWDVRLRLSRMKFRPKYIRSRL